ncbi:MAG: putative transposase, partial [Solirubrobacteraceae bacterium]
MAIAAQELPGMPEAVGLQLLEHGGEVFVFRGPHLFSRYDNDDLGMRNLAVVALSDAGVPVNEVAACFKLSRQYVSMLRGRAKDSGSAGLVRPRGRTKSLTVFKWHKALSLSDDGVADREIARRFGVHHGTVARRLALLRAERGTVSALDLKDAGAEGPGTDTMAPEEAGTACGSDHAPDPEGVGGRLRVPLGPNGTKEVPSRYAGAMLLHPFLGRLGVDDVVSGIGDATARRYDAACLVLSSAFGFALGVSSLEGAKHLRVKDAGALVGASSFPHLRTLRPRLKDLAEACDPLEIQRAFAKAMLAADDHPPELFYVDDHFVTYWGARPVAKGYNIRRHLAEPGRDDTFLTDEHWRAICFSSGEPRGLSVSMAEVIGQLQEITPGRR